MHRIKVFNAYSKYKILIDETKLVTRHVLKSEGNIRSEINIVYINDKEMIELNTKYLNHKRTTDVISFYLGDEHKDKIEGEVYINLDQARYQADEYGVPFKNEVYRLVIHGVLHLLGYSDKSGKDKMIMANLENKYLEILN